MTSVAAVSIAEPRTYTIHGMKISTSIARDPHPGPIMFALEGPVGNVTAVHSEQVLATSTETYDFWMAHLGIPRAQWPHCYWGENLTLSGIDENDVCVGDRIKIGPSAEFEVTSPRIPCIKLTWRLQLPDSFLQELVADGRVGFYMRTITAGQVEAGDTVSIERRHPDNISITALSRLMNDSGSDVEQLRRALANPGLSPLTATLLRDRITQITDVVRCQANRWQEWRRFIVSDIKQESSEVRSYELTPEDGQPLAEYRAGQFLTVRLPHEGKQPLMRPWSVSDYLESGSSYRISVRRGEPGGVSERLHDDIRTGNYVEVRSPAGRFVLDRSELLRVVLISAGIGVTPLLSMLKAHIARSDPSPLLWIHVTRNGSTHAFKEETDALIKSHPNLRSHIIYTAPLPEDRLGLDYDEAGRPSLERYVELLGGRGGNYKCNPFGREIDVPGQMGSFYICGPKAFEDAVRAALLDYGAKPSGIHSESFAEATFDGLDGPETCEVRFVRSGKTAIWRRDTDASLLGFAESAGLAPAFSCRAGTCHSCTSTLVSGEVNYSAEALDMKERDRILLCCTQPRSEVLELDL